MPPKDEFLLEFRGFFAYQSGMVTGRSRLSAMGALVLLGCSSGGSAPGDSAPGGGGGSALGGGTGDGTAVAGNSSGGQAGASSGVAGAGGLGGSAGASSTVVDPLLTLGDQETLLASGAFGLDYFPDEGTSIISYDPFRIAITDGFSKSSFILGAEADATDPLRQLTVTPVKVLSPGAAGEFDNGYVGLSAVYRHSNGVWYGFYHGEDQEGMDLLPGTQIPGFYARIGLAYSADGLTWQKAGYVIESVMPKRTPGGDILYDQGAAEPGVVASADGKYLYLYYTDHARDDGTGVYRPVTICMARADLSAWPPAFPSTPGPIAAFKKYYQGSFSADGIGGSDTPVVNPPTSLSNSLEGHVVYSASLAKYVMVYGVDAWDERTTGTALVSGLYLAFSDDGIEWRRGATPFIRDFGVAWVGRSVSWQASFLWDEGSDTAGWLVYGYSPTWSTPGHYLVGRRFSLAAP